MTTATAFQATNGSDTRFGKPDVAARKPKEVDPYARFRHRSVSELNDLVVPATQLIASMGKK